MPHAASAEVESSWPGAKLFSYPSEPVEELRKRYQEDGYIFMKGLIPRKDVLKARESYFKGLAPSGVLKPGTKPVEGIFDDTKDPLNYPGIGAGAASSNGRPGGESAEVFVDLALKQHTEPWYCEEFAKHPALYDFISKLTGWGNDTLSLKRRLLRNNTPGNKAIGVHYDQIFLRYGEPTSVTSWVPMGDVSVKGGHNVGQRIENEFTEKAKANGLTEEEAKYAFNRNMMSTGFLAQSPAGFGREHGARWLLTDYEAGDAVLHQPHSIHASTINHDSQNKIRVGTDLRFVNSARPYDRWTNYFQFNDGV
ncbi:phytanoyl-CoA hydroxylase [Phyllosticta citrichinensis]|uniref:Phytanoyl-CoA hydroxylase n=1 Tax=Phyllosticta citrichinensis TaxID=1130410 RepID=A0ABR1XFC2_9PEZI